MTEDKLQYELAQFLRANDILFFHVPNGGRRGKREAAKFVAMGVLSGVHDLIVLLPNACVLLIELKLLKGKLSPSQKIFHEKVINMGYRSYVIHADTAEEGKRQLKSILLENGQKCD